jgi:GlcNAc-P-P-Und epimerase
MSQVLITGANGFLGKKIEDGLSKSGHTIVSLGQKSGHISVNLATNIPDFGEYSFELVVHAAGKAHVIPKTAKEAAEFFAVNVSGTKNLCEGLAKKPPKYFVFISTVAVYGKFEGVDISELNPLVGDTPYAKSKIEAEQFLMDWCQQQGVVLTIFRLPLIIGEEAPGNLGDMFKGIANGKYFRIGSGAAKKSMVMAHDIPVAIEQAMAMGGIYNLTDGYHPSFAELENAIAKQFNKKAIRSLPMWLAKLAGFVGDIFAFFPVNSLKLKKITSTLTFDDSKARKAFGWKPSLVLNNIKVNE